MKKVIKWLVNSTGRIACISAMALAVASVSNTCTFVAYQPDVPSKFRVS